jgi:hypothetical protein
MAAHSKSGGLKVSGLTSIALPGRKLVTSKKPRMLTRSEIELLRQDLSAALKVVGPDEIEDAEALLQANGYAAEEFEIIQQATPSPSLPSAISGSIVVVRTTSGAAKEYDASSGSRWLMDLDADLKGRAFGSPQ